MSNHQQNQCIKDTNKIIKVQKTLQIRSLKDQVRSSDQNDLQKTQLLKAV